MTPIEKAAEAMRALVNSESGEWVDFEELAQAAFAAAAGASGEAPTFEQAWAAKEREGYQYGEDALEHVRFGWEIREAVEGARVERQADLESLVLSALGAEVLGSERDNEHATAEDVVDRAVSELRRLTARTAEVAGLRAERALSEQRRGELSAMLATLWSALRTDEQKAAPASEEAVQSQALEEAMRLRREALEKAHLTDAQRAGLERLRKLGLAEIEIQQRAASHWDLAEQSERIRAELTAAVGAIDALLQGEADG